MTPAQFLALIPALIDGAADEARATRAALIAELKRRGLTDDESDSIVRECFDRELAKREAARVAARASKLAAIRTALGLP